MKNILIYVSVVLLILGSLITVLIFNKKDINDSVVYIESIDDETIKSGSGFVYKIEDGKNYIITSYHVIEGYNDIYVYNSGKEKIKANILNYDEYTDIAILTVENKLGLNKIDIGNSNKVSIDDQVIAVGTPNNIENINTISKGKISELDKKITFETMHGSSNLSAIEVNIDVTYGNSGGPLLNNKNEVIGMVFIKEENQHTAYALPINFVMELVGKLENHELNRPNLGAVMCNATNTELLNEYEIEIKDIDGVVILDLNENGLLHKEGLQIGDVITEFNGNVISNVNNLREELYKNQIGNKVWLEYYRNGVYYKVDIEL